MDPEKNNLSSNMGVPGMSGTGDMTGAGSSSIDFTGNNGMAPSADNLSMNDSLASAQDSLTSAGMAASTPGSGAIGLDQLSSSDPSATMASPLTDPLVPAAPVPGSIGSAMSAPAAAPAATAGGITNDMMSASSAPGMFGTTSANPATTATPTMTMGTPDMTAGATTTMTTGGAADALSAAAAASSAPAQAPFNPFAQTSTSGSTATPTSSTTIPPALQPPVEKFSAKKGAGGKMGHGNLNMLTIVMAVLIALLTVSTIVFASLWLSVKDKEKIVYAPPITDGEVGSKMTVLNCSLAGVTNPIEGLEGLVSYDRTLTAHFKDGEVTSAELLSAYNFADNGLAEAARGFFDGRILNLGLAAAEAGVAAPATELNIADNWLNFSVEANASQLVGGIAGDLMLMREDGSVMTTVEDIEAAYMAMGFVCIEE